MTFSPEVGEAGRLSGRSAFSERHAGELASFGIARKASGPGTVNNVPFTVLEENPEGLRQRFILWTKDANGWLDERYTAQVGVELPGEIWTVSFWLRPSLKSKNRKTTHT